MFAPIYFRIASHVLVTLQDMSNTIWYQETTKLNIAQILCTITGLQLTYHTVHCVIYISGLVLLSAYINAQYSNIMTVKWTLSIPLSIGLNNTHQMPYTSPLLGSFCSEFCQFKFNTAFACVALYPKHRFIYCTVLHAGSIWSSNYSWLPMVPHKCDVAALVCHRVLNAGTGGLHDDRIPCACCYLTVAAYQPK